MDAHAQLQITPSPSLVSATSVSSAKAAAAAALLSGGLIALAAATPRACCRGLVDLHRACAHVQNVDNSCRARVDIIPLLSVSYRIQMQC